MDPVAVRVHAQAAHLRAGNVGETARLKVNGVGQQHATLAAAQGSLTAGYPTVSSAYADGWHAYLFSLKPPPTIAESSSTTCP